MAVMNYKQTNRYPDGTGMLLDTTPGTPDSGSYTTEAQLKAWINADIISGAQVVGKAQKDQNGNVIDATYATKAELNADVATLQSQIDRNKAEIENLKQTTKQDEQTVQYPDDGNYSSIMPNGVPARVAKYGEAAGIRGKSRGWNQLFKATSFVDFCSKVTDYQISISFDSSFSGYRIPMDTVPTINGHKYLIYIKADSGTNVRTAIYGIIPYYGETSLVNGVVSILTGDGNNCAVQLTPMTVGQAGSGNLYFIFRDVTNILSDWADADITTANIPLMVQQIPDLLKWDDYGYSLVETTVEGVEAIGVNIWDEVTKLGYYDVASGGFVSRADGLCSENDIDVEPSTVYYLMIPSGLSAVVLFYDKTGNYLNQYTTCSNSTFTTPANCHIVKMHFNGYGTTYNHDIQICLNSYADKTTYHPYQRDTLMLSTPVTLKSAGSVAEVLTLETGKKTRPIGTVTYDGSNDEDWRVYGSGVLYIANSSIKTVAAGVKNNLICDRLTNVERGNIFNGIDYTICTEGQIFMVYINSSTSDVASLRTWLGNNPITINFELDTPLSDEQVCDPIIDNYIEVQAGGTINTIQSQTPVIDNCLDVTYDFIPA